MTTVFGTILPLIAKPLATAAEMKSLCSRTPLERLAIGLDALGADELLEQWPRILDIYETFLSWKEDDNIEKYLHGGAQKATVREYADTLSSFLFRALSHSRIKEEYRRYLVL